MRKTTAIFLLFFVLACAGAIRPGAIPAAESLSGAAFYHRPHDYDPGYGRGGRGVDQDLFPYHAGDTNQFGNDEAYNSMTGQSAIGNLPPLHDNRH